MALHGEVKVNGSIVAFWEAVRIQPEILDVNAYRCKVMTCAGLGIDPYHDEITGGWEFILEHRYSDGAIVLASKVLTQAHELLSAHPKINRMAGAL